MVNKSAPAKQAAAWSFLKFLDDPKNMTTWAIGTGYLMVAHPAFPAKTVKDVIALAKSQPGKIRYSTAGVGNDLRQFVLIELKAAADLFD